MKNIIKAVVVLAMFLIFTNCQKPADQYEVKLVNPASIDRIDEYVQVQLASFTNLDVQSVKTVKVEVEGTAIPAQLSDVNGDSLFDVVGILVDLKVNDTVKAKIIFNPTESEQVTFPARTYAELAIKEGADYVDGKFIGGEFVNKEKLVVPAIHMDHDNLFKYEGPGWESDKVGFRFYLDWRNAIDIYGKKTSDMVLKNVGIKDKEQGTEHSYHRMADWGMDILKVGKSLGIGSIAMMQDGKIVTVAKTDSVSCGVSENGIIRSGIQTNYAGWQVGDEKYNLQSNISICAGSRISLNEITIDNNAENIATGIVKLENTNLLKSDGKPDGWNYIATYGKQSLADDSLGMVIFYKSSDLIELTEDNDSHIVVLKLSDGKVGYYFGAAWEKELNGVKNQEEFVTYLNNKLILLDNPVALLFQ